MKYLLTYFLLAALMICSIEGAAQDTLCINPIQTTVGDQIQVDITIGNFVEIISLQYSITFNSNALAVESVGNFHPDLNLSENNFGLELDPGAPSGYTTFSWFDGSGVSGVTLDNDEVIYTLFFTVISGENSEVFIDYDLTGVGLPMVEAVNADGMFLNVKSLPYNIYANAHFLSGNLYLDENENCLKDLEDGLGNWLVTFENSNETRTAETDENGDYLIILNTGDYIMEVISPDENLVECNTNLAIDLIKSATQNIGMTLNTPSSLFEQSANSIKVYPNPSFDVINFELENETESLYLEVYNNTGKLLLSKNFESNNFQLSKDAMKTGIYFYHIRSEGKILAEGKFVFQ